MAAGDLLSDIVYQHECGGYLVGPGTPWGVERAKGWLDRVVRSSDTPYDLVDGASGGTDTEGPKVISLDLDHHHHGDGDLGDTLFADLIDLRNAFPIGPDVELHAVLPALGHVYVVGRCRGILNTDIDDPATIGELQPQVIFEALDPTIHQVTP